MERASELFDEQCHRTGSLYGAFAFGCLVLSCFGGYFFYSPRYFNVAPWAVPVTFGLGALYAALGVAGSEVFDCRRPVWAGAYYVLQCVILTVMIFVSPLRGFFGIIVLPLMSQAIFDLRPRGAVAVGLYLLGINVALWAIPFGWQAGLEAVVNYAAGFAFTIVFTIITKRALLFQARELKMRLEIEEAHAKLRASAAQAEELATVRERNRVAREIHDGVGHYLTVVKTQLDAAAAVLPTQPEKARAAIEQAARLAGEALDDVRRSVGSLRTEAARPPLPEALRGLTADLGVAAKVEVIGEPRSLPPGVEHALFRCAQEGLTNVRKHAAASAAQVTLDFSRGGAVTLGVTDNGRGVSGGEPRGFGLTGMRERIDVLGGRVEAGNRPGGGFALRVEVPA